MSDPNLQDASIPLQGSSGTSLQGGDLNVQGSTPNLQAPTPTTTPATPTPTPTPAPAPAKTVAPKAVVTSNQAREATAQNQQDLTQTIKAITPQTYNFMNETVDADPNSGKVFGVRPNQQQPAAAPAQLTPTEQKQVKTDSATGNTTTTTTTTDTPTPNTTETPDQKAAREENAAIDNETQQFNSLIDGRIMKNDAATETLISAIQQKYAQQREEMKKYNDAVIGGTNTLGIRSGRQRYASEVQQGILSEEVRKGGLRLAEIDQQESSAIFQAQQANEDKDFALLNQKMQQAKDARTEKRQVAQDLYQKTLDMEKLALQRSQEDRAVRELDLKTDQYALNVQNTLADNSRQALATILTNFGGLAFEDLDPDSQKQLDELAQSVGIPTGILKGGLQTIKERQMMTQVLQFGEKQALEQQKIQIQQQQNDIKNQIALMRVAISQKNATTNGKNAMGLTPSQVSTTVNQIRGSFDNEPIVKQYNTIADSINTFKNLGSSPTDDIYRIYAFAKVADPNSAVREGEYKTVQEYSTALLQRVGLNAKRVFDNSGFLTDEARKFMTNTLDTRLSSSKKGYDNVASEYQRQIDDAYAGKPEQITDYGKAYNSSSTDDPLDLGL